MRNQLFIAVLSVTFWITCTNLGLAQDLDSLIIQGKNLIHDGFYHQDEELLLRSQTLLQEAISIEEGNALLHYFLGLAGYRLAEYYIGNDGNSNQAKEYLKDSIKHLKICVKQNKRDAEAYALLASCYGLKIATKPISGITLGPKAHKHSNQSKKLNPNNPRLFLLLGKGNYFKPKIFGGGKENALKELEKALQLFEGDNISDPKIPGWGLGELHAWLGKIYMELDEIEKATKHLHLALQVEPKFSWVTEELVPQLKEIN